MPRSLLLPLLLLASCGATGAGGTPTDATMDSHSHAEPARVRVRHVDLDLEIDFESRELRGEARLQLVRTDAQAPLVLDQQGLAIAGVRGSDGSARAFRVGAEHDGLGSALTIELGPRDDSVTVVYATTDRADALQWLEPAQTAGGQRPFLFTQGQAVLTRTWIPLQDSPQVRVTFAGRVHAPRGLTVLMSAEQLGQGTDGSFRFRMQHPVPPYLIALACGELAFRPLSDRCGIWAEPPVADRARDEFADAEAMIRAAESLFGPYRWGRYDLLVLPPSFPFGGMENPCLTFATPTVLAGDRSLVSLVAHELAHSWSGNLVTNATWRDFWLNEGFTVYCEQRIMEHVFGRERSRMELQLARADLVREMAELEPWETVLHVELDGRHPDDGFSGVPYTKGALFLIRIEELFGRERFDAFLRRWFDAHAFQSVTTSDLVAFLEGELFPADPIAARALAARAWIEEPGLPSDAPDPRSTLLAEVDRQIARWNGSRSAESLDTSGWVTGQWLHFLEGIADAVDAPAMAALDARFGLTSSGNAEVLCVWSRLAIRHGYAAADAALEAFLTDVGRRKFLEPLYKELCKTPAGKARARTLYDRLRPRYHAVSRGTIDEIVMEPGSTPPISR